MSDKLYRIGEAAALLNLKSYVLRFWETEFPQLEPVRTDKGQRLYTEEHVELLKLIKHLLHERGLTIDGARRILKSSQMEPSHFADSLAHTLNAVAAPPFAPDALSLGHAPLEEEAESLKPFSAPEAIETSFLAAKNGVLPSEPPAEAYELSSLPAASLAWREASSCASCQEASRRAKTAEEIARQYELLLDELILELEDLRACLANNSSPQAAMPEPVEPVEPGQN